MANLGLIHADGNGDIIRVARLPHEYAEARELPGADATVVVALDAGDNDAKLRDIAENSRLYKVVGGVVKKGNVAVVFDLGDDGHAAAQSLHVVTTAQERTMMAGARAVIERASTPSATNEEKAIGWLYLRLLRLEDR